MDVREPQPTDLCKKLQLKRGKWFYVGFLFMWNNPFGSKLIFQYKFMQKETKQHNRNIYEKQKLNAEEKCLRIPYYFYVLFALDGRAKR